jgi:hypothetical protein
MLQLLSSYSRICGECSVRDVRTSRIVVFRAEVVACSGPLLIFVRCLWFVPRLDYFWRHDVGHGHCTAALWRVETGSRFDARNLPQRVSINVNQSESQSRIRPQRANFCRFNHCCSVCVILKRTFSVQMDLVLIQHYGVIVHCSNGLLHGTRKCWHYLAVPVITSNYQLRP